MIFDQQLRRYFYHLANLEYNPNHMIGTMDNIDPRVVHTYMQKHVEVYTRLMLMEEKVRGKGSLAWYKLLQKRFITYREFLGLFDNEIDILRSLAFRYFNKYNQRDLLNYFSSLNIIPDEMGFEKLLSEQKTSIAPFFRSGSLEAALDPLGYSTQHTYCVAKSRSGKSSLMQVLLYNLVREKRDSMSIVLIDPHADLAFEMVQMKMMNKDLNELVYITQGLKEGYQAVLNPLEVKNKKYLTPSLDSFVEGFAELLPSDRDSSGSMKRLLRHCAYNLMYHDGHTLLDLLHLVQAIGRNASIKNPDNYKFSEKERRLMRQGQEVDNSQTRIFFERDWKEIRGTTAVALSDRLDEILGHEEVKAFLCGKSTFNLEHHMNNGKIVIFNLDQNIFGELGTMTIGKFIFAEVKNVTKRRADIPKHQRPRTMCMIDECQLFLNKNIEQALSQLGKFNTTLFLAHQYVGQLDDKMTDAIYSNTEIKIIGRNSSTTMSLAAKEMGGKVTLQQLLNIKKYYFYVKYGDSDPMHVKVTPRYLYKPGSRFYISKDALDEVFNHMVERYYDVSESISGESHFDQAPRRDDAMKSSHSNSPIENVISTPPFNLYLGTDEEDQK